MYIKVLLYTCFTPFCFNAPYQYPSHPHLCPLIFGLTLFGWFISIYLSLFSYGNVICFMPTFLGTQLGHKQGLHVIKPCCLLV